MQRTFSPEALARREARKAETKARNEAKKQAFEAARQAEILAARQAYIATQQKQADDFKAALSPEDWADLQEALNEKSSEVDATGWERITNDWLHSVKQQFANRGWLSPKQLGPLLHRVRQRRLLAEQAKEWADIKVGQQVKLWCTVVSSTAGRGDYGVFYKIKLKSHYGRSFSITTSRVEWHELAVDRREVGKKVMIVAKVKWMAPDAGGPVVLTSRGAKFGDLL